MRFSKIKIKKEKTEAKTIYFRREYIFYFRKLYKKDLNFVRLKMDATSNLKLYDSVTGNKDTYNKINA